MLGPEFEFIAPEHYGCQNTGSWTGEHVFTLADEAARTIALIDAADRSVHLVAHSYGGGVALHVALARPDRIASLTIYEPSAFHLLKQFGDRGAAALAEIEAVAIATRKGVVSGDYRGAAASFVDYWSGAGTWNGLDPAVQRALVAWTPKAPLDFAALMEEPTLASAYARLRFPILIMRGEHAPAPTRLISETLPSLMPDARFAVIAGAGHMGPLTHAAPVNALIVQHIRDVHASRGKPSTDAVALAPPQRAARKLVTIV